jgi:hypothetical protein
MDNKADGPSPKGEVSSPAGKYDCPKCDNTIEVFFQMVCAPECHRHKTTGPVKMAHRKAKK